MGIGPRGGSIGTIGSASASLEHRTELISPQLTISSIERPPQAEKKGFQNQIYYSP